MSAAVYRCRERRPRRSACWLSSAGIVTRGTVKTVPYECIFYILHIFVFAEVYVNGKASPPSGRSCHGIAVTDEGHTRKRITGTANTIGNIINAQHTPAQHTPHPPLRGPPGGELPRSGKRGHPGVSPQGEG